MNILVVNNNSKHTAELKEFLTEHKVKIVKYRKHSHLDREWADIFILTGSNKPAMYRRYYSTEISLIQQTSKPIIGICLGFELIANAYGSKLHRQQNKVSGLQMMELTSDYFGFESGRYYDVFEAHRWTLKNPENLDVLARSVNGAEIIKHPTRHIIGFQFHPEVLAPRNEGGRFLLAAINIFSNN